MATSTAPRPPKMFAKMEPKRRDSLLKTIIYLGEAGFHARTIARVAGVTAGQVYAVCAKFQIKLRAYRDGRNETAERVIVRAPFLAIRKVDLSEELKKEYAE